MNAHKLADMKNMTNQVDFAPIESAMSPPQDGDILVLVGLNHKLGDQFPNAAGSPTNVNVERCQEKNWVRKLSFDLPVQGENMRFELIFPEEDNMLENELTAALI